MSSERPLASKPWCQSPPSLPTSDEKASVAEHARVKRPGKGISKGFLGSSRKHCSSQHRLNLGSGCLPAVRNDNIKYKVLRLYR